MLIFISTNNEILMAAANNGNKIDVKSVIEWGFKLVTIFVLPLVIWMITLLISVDKRLAILEENRFTAADGVELSGDVNFLQTEVLKMENRISSLEACQIKIRTGDVKSC